jgi:hypothetical protein
MLLNNPGRNVAIGQITANLANSFSALGRFYANYREFASQKLPFGPG